MQSIVNRTRITGALLALGHAAAIGAFIAQQIVPGVVLVLVTHAFFLWGTLRANSQLFGPVVRSFDTPREEVWLTIDDGVDPATTPQLLTCLEAHGALATFFVIGERAERHPKLIGKVAAAGHQVGNHSRTHPQATFWAQPPWRLRHEIGADTDLYRSPVGMSNWFVHAYLRERNSRPIGWSVRGHDGIGTRRDKVLRSIVEGIRPGAIVLLHEGYDTNRRGYAPVDILQDLLDELRTRGYRCVLPEPSSWRT